MSMPVHAGEVLRSQVLQDPLHALQAYTCYTRFSSGWLLVIFQLELYKDATHMSLPTKCGYVYVLYVHGRVPFAPARQSSH
jgi:hypothetical protein